MNRQTQRNIKSEDRIRALSRFGSRPGLERMRALMDRLGNPQRGLRVIHVAGTNGKGSVCRYVYDVLRANGFRVGLFTSPFMTDFRDAVVCNDVALPRASLDAHTDRVFCAIDGMCAEGLESPTEFEAITALTLLFFREEAVDFAVLEVGLGGAGDSTNIIDDCLLSVVTSVSLDHCAVLGDTVEAIAREKAGIFKTGRPVVNGAIGAAKAVIERAAREKGCRVFDAAGTAPRDVVIGLGGTTFGADIEGVRYERLRLSAIGRFQAENAVCALYAIHILREIYGVAIDGGKLREGMLRAALPGRFERIDLRTFPGRAGNVFGESGAADGRAAVVFDGAHNPDGMRRIAETVRDVFPQGRTLTVFSALRDKNIDEMLGICADFSAKMILTGSEHERSADAESLSGRLNGLRRANRRSDARDAAVADPREAFETALAERGDFDLILVTGSLYLIRQLQRCLRG
ncbi:MAG: bifunctional folylpolyglutamate synthase/dihydrofolate synthase [Clostridiales Family XIII bacterium]|jgi:dihydrofolate synthase/folylpolyglutamate synthase|nr:bifunctional folylpolyglutamate synthase/dihydrofolate synthase [Clostridiales Family XIII bacterium]